MNGRKLDVVFAGVGGQGSVLASRLMAEAARRAGFHVSASEVHGMSQRGGSVFSTVRIGSPDAAASVPAHSADILVAFEIVEGLRYLNYLAPSGTAVVARTRITPTVESLRLIPYPEDPEAEYGKAGAKTVFVDAASVARQLGNPRLANTVVLGVVSNLVPWLPEEAWTEAVRVSVPKGTVELNLKAFARGKELTEGI